MRPPESPIRSEINGCVTGGDPVTLGVELAEDGDLLAVR
jgi:hypothetical protein